METLQNFDVNQVAFFGDWHGNLPFAISALQNANDQTADVYVHVGDFGFWPLDKDFTKYIFGLEALLASSNRTLLWIDGNHEDHKALNEIPVNESGLRPITEHIIHLPRGSAVLLGGKKLVALGGARSIDRNLRVKDVDWFEEETITLEDAEKAKSHGRADILVTHEAPEISWYTNSVDSVVEIFSQEQRNLVNEVRRELAPQVLIHGHHHRKYEDKIGITRVIGLGCDAWPLKDNSISDNTCVLQLSSNGDK